MLGHRHGLLLRWPPDGDVPGIARDRTGGSACHLCEARRRRYRMSGVAIKGSRASSIGDHMKKIILAFALAAASSLVTSSAFADETLKEIIVYGKRPARPSVIIELKRSSAAEAAGAAHELLLASLVEQSRPATLSK